MITAMQSARHKVANRLLEAREALLDTHSSIVWTDEEADSIKDIVSQIDELYATMISNLPATGGRGR